MDFRYLYKENKVMVTWTVKYKRQGKWFFRRIHKVKGECILHENMRASNGTKSTYPVPVIEFFKENETVVIIPMEGTEFIYGPNRHLSILEKIEKQKRGEASAQVF